MFRPIIARVRPSHAPSADAPAIRMAVPATSASHEPPVPTVVPRSDAARANASPKTICKATANAKTETTTTAMRTTPTRSRRGSQVRRTAIVPTCQSAPTDDAPITSPSTIRMNAVPFKKSDSADSCSELLT